MWSHDTDLDPLTEKELTELADSLAADAVQKIRNREGPAKARLHRRQFGDAIRAHRITTGLTTADVSQASGLTLDYLEALEKGDIDDESVGLIELASLAQALGLSMSELCDVVDSTASGGVRGLVDDTIGRLTSRWRSKPNSP